MKMKSLENYDIGEFLGCGGFASVYRARCRTSGNEYAIKMIDKSMIRQNNISSRVQNEIKVHQSISHENIVSLYDHFEDDKHICMVLQVCQGGNMFRYLRKTGPMSEDSAGHVVHQILSAIQYLHGKHIVHRDLKLSNILIGDSSLMTIKICDFGLAVGMQHPDEEHFTLCGTPNYIAPEIAGQSSYSFPADIWAIGCLFYCMVTGMSPFEQQDVNGTLQKILTGQYAVPTFLSAEGLDFLHQLLQMDPQKRPNARQIIRHSFMTRCSKTAASVIEIASSLASKVRSSKEEKLHKRNKRRDSDDSNSLFSLSGRLGGSSRDDLSDGSLSRLKRSESPDISLTSRAALSSHVHGKESEGGDAISARNSLNRSHSEATSSNGMDASTDGGRLSHCHLRLISSQTEGEKDNTIDLIAATNESPSKPLSWLQLLKGAEHGKGQGSNRLTSSSTSLSIGRSFVQGHQTGSNVQYLSASVNTSVDSTPSISYCHQVDNMRALGHSLEDSISCQKHQTFMSENVSNLPLLKIPLQPLLHCSVSGELLLSSPEGNIVFCTNVVIRKSAGGKLSNSTDNLSIPIRLLIKKKNVSKIFSSALEYDLLNEYKELIRLKRKEGDETSGFSFLSENESRMLSTYQLFTNSDKCQIFSIKDLPGWLATRYRKIYKMLEAVKCRLPKLILYCTSLDAISIENVSLVSKDFRATKTAPEPDKSRVVYCKCMLMSNDPLPDFCVQWADGVKLRYSLASGRLYLSSPDDPPNSPLYQWDGNALPTREAPMVPSWVQGAPNSVKKYLLVAQGAMQKCLEQMEQCHDANDEIPKVIFL